MIEIIEAFYHLVKKAMLVNMPRDIALQLLEFSSYQDPNEREVNNHFRSIMAKNHPDRYSGEEKIKQEAKAKYIGMAKEVLNGKNVLYDEEEFFKTYPNLAKTNVLNVANVYDLHTKKETFEEAISKARIDKGIQWLFRTDKITYDYKDDEVFESTTGWVTVGETKDRLIFVAIEHVIYIDDKHNHDYYNISATGYLKKWETLDTEIMEDLIKQTMTHGFKRTEMEFDGTIYITNSLEEQDIGDQKMQLSEFMAQN